MVVPKMIVRQMTNVNLQLLIRDMYFRSPLSIYSEPSEQAKLGPFESRKPKPKTPT